MPSGRVTQTMRERYALISTMLQKCDCKSKTIGPHKVAAHYEARRHIVAMEREQIRLERILGEYK